MAQTEDTVPLPDPFLLPTQFGEVVESALISAMTTATRRGLAGQIAA